MNDLTCGKDKRTNQPEDYKNDCDFVQGIVHALFFHKFNE
jgi:hypothetical protein